MEVTVLLKAGVLWVDGMLRDRTIIIMGFQRTREVGIWERKVGGLLKAGSVLRIEGEKRMEMEWCCAVVS